MTMEMDVSGTGFLAEGKDSRQTNVATSNNACMFLDSPGKTLLASIFSPRSLFHGENVRTPSDSGMCTPNTPSRCGLGTPTSSRMGTPCHPDFEPIDCTMMPPAKAASPPNEARGALYGSTEIGSPDLSCLLRDWTERTPEHDGAAYRERSSSSVASSTLLRPSQSGPAEALGLRSSPQIVQSPLALLEPAGHLVVASPLSSTTWRSPGRRRPEWRSPCPSFGAQTATPVSPLALEGTFWSQQSARQSSPTGATSNPGCVRLLGPAGLCSPTTVQSESATGLHDTSPLLSTGQPSAVLVSRPAPGQMRAPLGDPSRQPSDPAERPRDLSSPTNTAEDGDPDADDLSDLSPDSDEDMDQLDVPQAFCKPFLDGPDLLFSNRHLAYPHMDSPVLGHSRQVTRFGKVRFTVFPGVHWARDPRERRRQLAAARGIQSSGRRGKRKLAPKPQNSRCQQRVNRSGGACNRSE
ncbi:uncharacterized protein LOC122387499 [Amphibalanus amphitrite]|uniref:uncharacterized protein LOC122387499 n=1 Tax=Amphibalanus amphitrite TaxID=1232801 RepID=UPI001C915D1B|nr:uncharacterized protein LOC122387499 [Amphibalanus amphitrite]XP_043233690.1 uncharacterized protein LOC122387499 [Amphibalanus amphitrite]XP_043233691.1 uncharacterized protein LOC122387499 [Amphibalanus amphitrite]